MFKKFIEYKKEFHFLRKQWFWIVLLMLTAALAGLSEGVMITLVIPLLKAKGMANLLPWGFSRKINILKTMPLIQQVYFISLALIVVTIFKNVCIYIGEIINIHLQLIVATHFRKRAIDILMRMGLNFFQRQRLSDFQLIIDSYTDVIATSVVGLAGTSMSQICTIAILSMMLLCISWPLTCIALIGTAIVSLLLSGVSRKILSASRVSSKARSEFNRSLMDILHGMKTIRSFDQQLGMKQRFEVIMKNFANARMASNHLYKMVAPAAECLGVILLASVLMAGAWLMPQEVSKDLGMLLAFILIIFRLITPIRAVNLSRLMIIEKLPIMEKMVDLLQEDNKGIIKESDHRCPLFAQTIRFEGVWFHYHQDQDWVLSDVSLTIKCGSRVALVGPSGAGKSTLIDLLMRFYDPTQGKIFIDAYPLVEINSGSWRRQVGVVSQDIFLFNDTVMNNLLLANPKATPQEVMKASEMAFAHEFINSLPHGYDTLIGERGVLLSGGQRQRLAIARAFLAKSRVIIFDEATSSLDAVSERKVLRAIENLDRSVTVITIAHRLATVKSADWIYLIDSGRIIEQGTHVDLLRHEGLYKKLVELQRLTEEVARGSTKNDV